MKIPRFCIMIKCIYSGSEKLYPVIYYSELEAKSAIDGLPYSKIHNEITIKPII